MKTILITFEHIQAVNDFLELVPGIPEGFLNFTKNVLYFCKMISSFAKYILYFVLAHFKTKIVSPGSSAEMHDLMTFGHAAKNVI